MIMEFWMAGLQFQQSCIDMIFSPLPMNKHSKQKSPSRIWLGKQAHKTYQIKNIQENPEIIGKEIMR